ncbi:MAG: hypothetical protein HDS69_10465 [Bacteroidales bacterium]|nr:hypothetical protein [Bacteroidales bacterium]
MAERKTKYSQEIIAILRSEVENVVNRRIVSPADFDFLSQTILNAVKQPISPTTLKRIWSYVKDVGSAYNPERFTLCILAGFVGYRDIEDFIENFNAEDTTTQSGNYFGETISFKEIPVNGKVELRWTPDRVCVLKRISAAEFEVEVSRNAKLRVGDVVEFALLTQNAPAFFSKVMRAGSELVHTYVAGMRTGVTYRILDPNDE